MKCIIAFLLLSGLQIRNGYAQQDSVIIKGKLLNLDGRLYREAPGITFSRNNILAPSSELSVNAPLQPDGSFRTSLPLSAPSEEIYLDYGGKVFTTFLVKPGEVEIMFDADSMFKTARLFHFRGVNADANNFYPVYLEQEEKLFEANKHLGRDFQRTFWNQGLQSAKQSLLQRGNLRQRALTALLSEGKQSAELTEWINALVEDERATLLMEYSLENFSDLSAADDADVKRFPTSPLTYQRVLRANRLKSYAAKVADAAVRSRGDRRNANSLSVDKIAALILRYVSPLAIQEKDKLRLIVEKKNVDKAELDFLSTLYKRGGEKLATITNFEREVVPLKEIFEGPALEFLTAARFTDDFHLSMVDEKTALYTHIKGDLHNTTVKLAMDELYRIEVRDSSAVKDVLNASLTARPTEVKPGIWMAESTQNGRSWLEDIQKIYLGRPIYVINWDMHNDANREELESVALLRRQVSGDVVFLFLHVSDPERAQVAEYDLNSEDRRRWKQYVIRHRLEGTHLFLNPTQVMQQGLRTPGIPGTYYVIRPDGRYHSRSAPSPAKIQEAAGSIRAASEK